MLLILSYIYIYIIIKYVVLIIHYFTYIWTFFPSKTKRMSKMTILSFILCDKSRQHLVYILVLPRLERVVRHNQEMHWLNRFH